MLFRQAKLSSPEHSYDPKQRLVGGIVLFLLMMFLYLILKAVLGISSTGAAAALRTPFPDHAQAGGISTFVPGGSTDSPGKEVKLKYPLLEKFIFLDQNAKPMGKGSADLGFAAGASTEEGAEASADNSAASASMGNFIVQVASFKETSRAERLVENLKTSGMEASFSKSGNWYVVNLAPEKDRRVAEQHLRTLRGMGIRGIILDR
jgi:hypothetical protein